MNRQFLQPGYGKFYLFQFADWFHVTSKELQVILYNTVAKEWKV